LLCIQKVVACALASQTTGFGLAMASKITALALAVASKITALNLGFGCGFGDGLKNHCSWPQRPLCLALAMASKITVLGLLIRLKQKK